MGVRWYAADIATLNVLAYRGGRLRSDAGCASTKSLRAPAKATKSRGAAHKDHLHGFVCPDSARTHHDTGFRRGETL